MLPMENRPARSGRESTDATAAAADGMPAVAFRRCLADVDLVRRTPRTYLLIRLLGRRSRLCSVRSAAGP